MLGRGPRTRPIELAHRLWPNTGVPGQLSQDLPTPQHFEQASSIVTKEMIADADPVRRRRRARSSTPSARSIDAGVDHVYVHQIGDDQEAFLEAWTTEIAPELGTA